VRRLAGKLFFARKFGSPQAIFIYTGRKVYLANGIFTLIAASPRRGRAAARTERLAGGTSATHCVAGFR
jgi:hypothetical protein